MGKREKSKAEIIEYFLIINYLNYIFSIITSTKGYFFLIFKKIMSISNVTAFCSFLF